MPPRVLADDAGHYLHTSSVRWVGGVDGGTAGYAARGSVGGVHHRGSSARRHVYRLEPLALALRRVVFVTRCLVFFIIAALAFFVGVHYFVIFFVELILLPDLVQLAKCSRGLSKLETQQRRPLVFCLLFLSTRGTLFFSR